MGKDKGVEERGGFGGEEKGRKSDLGGEGKREME